MSKKSSLKRPRTSSSADRAAGNMNIRDLQRACVARGMDFDQVVESSVLQLHSWFNANYQNSQSLLLLDEYDGWKEAKLKKSGYTYHPDLRLGFIGQKDEHGVTIQTKKPRLKGLKKKEKSKRERLEGTNVFSGTKKALTYQLAKAGVAVKDVIAQVLEAFPEAKDKSVAIWFKRALNEMKGK